MKLNTFEKRFPAYAKAGISIELVSSPGRGKSETVRRVVRQMSERDGEEWGYADLFLATQTPPDLIGFQFKGEVTFDGNTYPITDPTMPTWFITESGKPVFAYEKGVLFLDEFGQGQTDVKAAAAELLLNKRIGKWKLPDGWIVIAASNKTSDRSGVTKSLDFVINRRMEIHISDDLESWLEWADKNGMMSLTKAFAEKNPQILFTEGVPDKQGPWCTPRSLAMADRLMQALRGDDAKMPTDSQTLEDVSGIIGAAAAAQYFAFVRLQNEMPSLETILKDPAKARLPDQPDAQMLVVYELAARVKPEIASKVITYVKRLPDDFGVTFIKSVTNHTPTLVMHPDVRAWINERASLLAMLGK